MEVRYSRPQEVLFLKFFHEMRGTPTKYFQDRATALNFLYGSRKEVESFPRKSLLTRNIIKYPSGRYGVIDHDESNNWSFGKVFEALQGGRVIGVIYFREDTKIGHGVWIEFDVKGHV